jgi:hypothetical protein
VWLRDQNRIFVVNPAGVRCELAVVWLRDQNRILVVVNPAEVLCELAVVSV